MATALPILLGPCVYLDALNLSPYLTPVLTRSWEDVDHTLGNASLQCQLCKLQGCEWGYLNGEQGRSLSVEDLDAKYSQTFLHSLLSLRPKKLAF